MTFFNEFFFFGVLFPPLAINAALDFKNIITHGLFTSVIVFGFVGSIFNFTITGLCLWGVHVLGALGLEDLAVKPIGFILFSSLICSTDLAIVLGLLGKLKVHPFLYLLFVGESLINDVFINLFYVLFIGLTMTPLLRIYKFLSSEPVRLSLFETLNGRVITSACHAMSDIVGYHHSALQAKLEELYRRYFRPLLLRDPNKHDEIADVYADIALALHHASVARDRSSVQFHLRQLRPQLKKAFYLQQQGVFKPLHHVSLHHIDFISEPTDMSAGGQNDLSLARPTPTHAPAFSYETSRGISSPESTEWEEAQEESYHDALCEKEVIVNSIQQPRGTKRNVTRHSWKQKACCTSKANLESPEPETNSADEVPEGDVGATDDCRGGGGGGVRAGDEEEGLFRQILSRHNRHTYVFDETAYAERVQQSIQSKHRALKLHHFHKT
ncbi:unnamed protein product [Mesocestoides corti]|uniref:Cation/H+ exchanger domain-containing protein n=1 Tax=Mesocestoides corti TaxID=53468 RepID=A0A0R3UGV0_MESCO|nr:unnamed protein product [Mesocestoides corti]